MGIARFSWAKFHALPVVGIARNIPAPHMPRIAEAYIQAGLTTLEVTLNSDRALDTIQLLVREFGTRLNIGAGTVFTEADVTAAFEAGAGFIVTPCTDAVTIKKSVALNLPIFAGAYTPTEIYTASTLGASLVKVFPAAMLGPAYIKQIREPMPHISLLPTGGIDLHNAAAYLQAGARGLGIGGSLFDKKSIADKNWAGLRSIFKRFAAIAANDNTAR